MFSVFKLKNLNSVLENKIHRLKKYNVQREIKVALVFGKKSNLLTHCRTGLYHHIQMLYHLNFKNGLFHNLKFGIPNFLFFFPFLIPTLNYLVLRNIMKLPGILTHWTEGLTYFDQTHPLKLELLGHLQQSFIILTVLLTQ